MNNAPKEPTCKECRGWQCHTCRGDLDLYKRIFRRELFEELAKKSDEFANCVDPFGEFLDYIEMESLQ